MGESCSNLIEVKNSQQSSLYKAKAFCSISDLLPCACQSTVGSRQIVSSILSEIDNMKVPTKDQQFIDNIEKINKIKRDIEAVELSSVLEQESILIKLENLLTNKVKDMWLLKAEDKGLLKKSTSSADRCKGFLEFLDGCKDMADWTIASNDALPASAKTKYSFVTTTLSTSLHDSSERSIAKKNTFFPCLACSADGCTDEEATHHSMKTCDHWNSLSIYDRKNLVHCIKHPFKNHKTENCTDSIGKCYHSEKQNDHHPLLCPAKKVNSTSNLAPCKTAFTETSHVMLKTMFVDSIDPGQTIGIIEDNCSTDDYITHSKAQEMRLKPVCDIVLEIAGINSVKQLASKVYQVPLLDKKKNLHFVECYGLDEITRESLPLNICSCYHN